MGRKKDYYLVVDTETANGLDEPLPYDIGYAICDRAGNILVKRSFIVAEIFLDRKDLMTTAYYAEKIPRYWKDIKEGKRTIKKTCNIRKQMMADMKEFKVTKVAAYNMRFDRMALNNLVRYTSYFVKYWFPYNTEFCCIWHMACQVIMDTKTYVKYALQNDFVSEANYIQTSAEACYRFLIKQPDFKENHTGLEDVEIEIEILKQCFKTHRKMKKTINRLCWQIPQQTRKKLQKAG